MTMARRQLLDLEVTRYYHCISRCVRRAFLCGAGFEHRKQWIEDRVELLAESFAIAVCGFAVMDNHLHLLARLDRETADGWSDEEVVRRWSQVYPPKGKKGKPRKVSKAWFKEAVANVKQVGVWRERLGDLGWFMKSLKEPLARMANKEDGCRGTFWEGRYKSIAILDEEALLATCAYIDLNPVAAGLVASPEAGLHTSIRSRLQYVKSKGKLELLKSAKEGSVAGVRQLGDIEQGHWLCPFFRGGARAAGRREGMLEGFSLGSYLLLVDYTSRLRRQGKARVNDRLTGIFDRLGTTCELWSHRMERLFSRERLMGNFFATDQQKLRRLAELKGVHHLDNLCGAVRA